jgi:hypothetical protein
VTAFYQDRNAFELLANSLKTHKRVCAEPVMHNQQARRIAQGCSV